MKQPNQFPTWFSGWAKSGASIGFAIAFGTAPASAVLVLFDDFEDGAVATGGVNTVQGGFQLVTNNATPDGGIDENNGGLVATAGNLGGGTDNTGAVSINSFVPSSGPSMEVTWDVVSVSDFSAAAGERVLFTLSDSTNFRGGPDNTATGEGHISLEFRGNSDIILRSYSGSNTVVGSFTLAELVDGFSVTARFDASGWSYSFTGLESNLSPISGVWGNSGTEGSLADTFPGATFVAATTRRASMRLDSVRVDITPIPEPSTALLSLSATGLVIFRRHRPDPA